MAQKNKMTSIRISEEIHGRFKAKVARERKKMKAVAEALIREYLAKKRPEPGQ